MQVNLPETITFMLPCLDLMPFCFTRNSTCKWALIHVLSLSEVLNIILIG